MEFSVTSVASNMCDQYFFSIFTNVMNHIQLIAMEYEKSVNRLREITQERFNKI